MVVTAIGAPLGRAISTWWVSRWVSTPTTASMRSASMGTGVLLSGSGHVGTGPGSSHRVAYLWRVTPEGGQASSRPSGGPGRCRRPQWTGQPQGTPKRPDKARVTPRSPAPSLVVLHQG